MKTKTFFYTWAVPALLCVTSIATAQKLPNKQQASVFAPANIKVDGRVTEWEDTFKAYNTATELYYTLSNDDKNLYLAVGVKYRNIIDKILRGGITVTVSPTTDKKDPKRVSITYLVLVGTDIGAVAGTYSRKRNEMEENKGAPVEVADLNDLYTAKEKIIKVNGIEGITDEELPIYNTEGIKLAALFDENLNYTIELAMPLKNLNLPDNSPFSYQLKVNERPTGKAMTDPVPTPMGISDMATTDFWAEYTLAKK